MSSLAGIVPASARSAAIDREEWGLTWNQPLDAGGVLIGRKVNIELDVQMVRTSICPENTGEIHARGHR